MNFKNKKLSMKLLMIFIFAAVLILINILVSDLSLRFDSTENKIYSLSNATHEIIKKTKNPITLKYFNNASSISDIPGEFKAYSKRIEDLLKEYSRYSKGKIILETIKPEIDSEEEDNANAFGLRGIELPGENNLYIGLAAISGEKEEIIPFFDPENEPKLEYELTSIISRLQSQKKKRIGILSSINILGGPHFQGQQSPKWYFTDVLEKQYELENLDLDLESIPEDIDLLILFQPKEVSEKINKQALKSLEKGKRLIILADPLSLLDPEGRMAPYSFPMKEELENYGIKFNETTAIADLNAATQIMGRDNTPELNPGWLSIFADGISQENIISANLENLLFPIAGGIEFEKKEGLSYESLAWSSKNSILYDPSMLQFQGMDALKHNFNPEDKNYSLALKVSGKFSKDNEAKGTLVLISDTDFLFDQFYMQKQNFLGFEMANMFNDNLNFFLNCVELMCGEPELIEIRSRQSTSRPFTKVKELEDKAKEKWLEKENMLANKAEQTKAKLEALQSQRIEGQNLVLSKEQEDEIKKFREEKKQIDKELKKVRRQLRADIESLGTKIKMLNIFLMPSIIALIGIISGIRRKRKNM
ncbi:MAG: Gldg family protein [Desulforegulaceae bacterium]|nr:Gldg family protein [Desulforegulaceae bacterium]